MREFEMRGGARDLLKYRGPEVVAVGSAGTGKSIAGLLKLYVTLATVPNCRGLLLRSTHTSLTASTLVSFEEQIAVDDLASGKVKWFGGSGRQAPGYIFPNGSRLSVGGLDKPGRVLSTEYDRITVDEANQISITAYEVLLTRLRGHADTYKQLVLMTNPDHPAHWIKERADAGKLTMLQSVHRDNPRLYDRNGRLTQDGAEYMAILDGLTGVRRLRYRDGRWVAAEGVVYPDWSLADHVIEPFPVPDEWPLLISIDWGFSHPIVVQFWRIDGDGRMYLTHEIARSGLLVEDVARRVKDMLESGNFPRPIAVVADHDAEDRATFSRHSKLTTTPAYKAVSHGVQMVQARLRDAGDGSPRVLVFRDSLMEPDPIAAERKQPRGVAAEIGGYVWAVERGTDGIPREHPMKINDDSMDCMRYAVAHQDRHEESKLGNPAKQQQQAQPQQGSPWSRPVGR